MKRSNIKWIEIFFEIIKIGQFQFKGFQWETIGSFHDAILFFDSKKTLWKKMGFQIVSFRLTRLVTRTKESNKFASIKSEQNFF